MNADFFTDMDVRLVTRAEYMGFIKTGIFNDEPAELLAGLLTKVTAEGPPHDAVLERLTQAFVGAFPNDEASIRIQGAYAASDYSLPEPDVALVPFGSNDDDSPSTAFLIIEVADSSLKKDRTKARIYAENGVPEYWIVNLVDKVVEVHTDVVRGEYSRITPHKPGDTLRPRELPMVELPVNQILR